ncbi:hypothetical protein BWP39_30030 [Paraburkholderia acidicola]|uniref:Uncharacterized protein n=1 Tax=Paraburkholderia acidicola TaxID=1912599 RepID=A0A2A4EUD1_9BURK|nr:hypothetical protein BWP39_30030 [Paraburkholderia acidicola]
MIQSASGLAHADAQYVHRFNAVLSETLSENASTRIRFETWGFRTPASRRLFPTAAVRDNQE